MTDVHALSGAYAVDALDDIERAQFERHLTECPACRAEVQSLREGAAVLGELADAAPPASLRAQVLSDIQGVRPLPPLAASVPGLPERSTRRRFPRPMVGLVAAAAAVIALGAGTAIVQPWDDAAPSNPGQVSAVEQILDAPDAEATSDRLDDGATVTVTRSKRMNLAVLETTGLPELPDDQTYELWLIHENQMVRAGLMDDAARSVMLKGDAASASGAGITIEPAGGSSVPSDDVVTVMSFENA